MPLLNQYRQQYPDVDLDFASGFEANPHELYKMLSLIYLLQPIRSR